MAISGFIKPLKDKQGNYIFPETSSEAVYCPDGKTLEDRFTDIIDISMTEGYQSIISSKIKDYSYDELISDITKLMTKYSSKLTLEQIGTSVLSRKINAIRIGSANASNKLLIFSGHHAREQHMASIILKQIEFYCENYDKKYNGETLSDIFRDSSIWFIPCINPDGLELCRIGIDSIPSSDTDRINKVKAALEFKIKNTLEIGSDITQVAYNELMTRCNNELSNYVFDNKDMYMWKANANGVDLHYNSWETGVNEDIIKNWSSNNSKPSTFASEDYIGEVGMGEAENVALKQFIDKYNLWGYIISYHGKGPTTFWNYNLSTLQLRRNLKITSELSSISATPFSESVNGNVGFAGYVYMKTGKTKYLTYCAIRETGWGNEKRNISNNYVDTSSPLTICPLEDYQQPWIWESEKYIPLHLLQKYVRRKDIIEREVSISKLDYSSSLGTTGYLVSPINGDQQIIEQWGTKQISFSNNQVVMFEQEFAIPFQKQNLVVYANCFNNVADNKFAVNCSKELNKIVVRVYSPTAITGNFNINWYAKGI